MGVMVAATLMVAADVSLGKFSVRDEYDAAREEAIRSGKCLVVWHGYHCAGTERQLRFCVHVRVQLGYFRDVEGECVLVLKPDGDKMYTAAVIEVDDVCARNILRACRGDAAAQTICGGST